MNAAQILVADIGGTNTRLGLAGPNGIATDTLRRFANNDHASFDALTRTYLDQVNVAICHRACLAVAAPIEAERVRLTNRDWLIDKAGVARETGAQDVYFLNDFEALGFSLDRLTPQQAPHIAGPQTAPEPRGVRMVLGAGTGFNAAALRRNALGQRSVHAAECGHMTLPVETSSELLLRDHLARGRGRASVERALSGQGVLEIHEWVCARADSPRPTISAAEIVAQALDGSDPNCRQTAEILIRFLARVAGDLVLAFLPLGGLYLSGGVTRACAELIASDLFWDVFTAKGRQSDLMRSIPVHLVEDDNAALEGCLSALTTTAA
jgi:glucokinase